MSISKYNCPNTNNGVTTQEWLPFAQMVSVQFPDVSFPFKGIHSQDSVMVVPFKKIDGRNYIGTIKERRPLFHEGWLTAFPAGKIESTQTPEEAAQLEALQEAGLKILDLHLLGVDMPFLHLCDEKVYSFVAYVNDEQVSTSLEDGEWISDKITWTDWNSFKSSIRLQQHLGSALFPVQDEAPMLGVSLTVANKLIVMMGN